MKTFLLRVMCAPARGAIYMYMYMTIIFKHLFLLNYKSKPNFMWSLLCKMFFCKNRIGHMIEMAARPIYWKKKTFIVFSRTSSPMILKLGMQQRRLEMYKVYINDR